ncbi:inactive peptidyl-prolyl cis-trans isomerase FKBP6 isoform X4 [Phycodurus eques]|uniref:inactive peptidyl-prolyl cis-trans isomerase FKBP6 isoform X4 n=1 Tax=Phycodurus eques TaxID=693459 RepID=UPI002ACD5CB3|nr:inactive peptidyl-prolyl cis-trans isomerase FKBP6 isoform X4 [Phycodurus eques]
MLWRGGSKVRDRVSNRRDADRDGAGPADHAQRRVLALPAAAALRLRRHGLPALHPRRRPRFVRDPAPRHPGLGTSGRICPAHCGGAERVSVVQIDGSGQHAAHFRQQMLQAESLRKSQRALQAVPALGQQQAVVLLGNRAKHSDGEQEDVRAALLPLYLNLSFAALRLENPKKALKYAKIALDIDCTSTKALYRCAQAHVELRDYESAHGCLVKVQARKPFDGDVNNLLKTVTMCYKDNLDKEKDLYAKMFRGLKNPDVKMCASVAGDPCE